MINAERYANGIRWLNSHGFATQECRPCYIWMKDGVMVFFLSNSSDWYATFNGWMGDYCDTPESAIRNLQEVCRRQRDEALKKAQSYGEADKRLGKALEITTGVADPKNSTKYHAVLMKEVRTKLFVRTYENLEDSADIEADWWKFQHELEERARAGELHSHFDDAPSVYTGGKIDTHCNIPDIFCPNDLTRCNQIPIEEI